MTFETYRFEFASELHADTMASLKKVDDRKDKVRVAEKELGDILKSLSSLRAVEQVWWRWRLMH
jgi:uncharacterized coiled-coil DUF342 family protein